MSVDLRTRVDGAEATVDVVTFFEELLPERFQGAADRLEAAARALPLKPLAVEVGGRSWTFAAEDGRITVLPGAHAAGVLRLDAEQLTDLVHDQVTPIGWFSSGRLDITGTRLETVLNWWLLLRAAVDGSTPYVAGGIDFTDAAGSPLDLSRTFRLGDPVEEMARFLQQAGFLHVAGVYSEAEMAAVSADMDRAAPRYSQGDGRSWWARLDGGADVLVRMQAFDTESPAVADLVHDERLHGLAGYGGDGHQWGARAHNRIEALFKPLGVVEGISDIPWHKDCSLGRHSYDCCSMNVGISVTGADAVSGQLRVLAGSNRALVWPAPTIQPGLDLPVVDLATETGDVTIHLSCTLHMAQPPVERPRRVMYTSLALPPLEAAGAEARAEGRRRLGAIRESAPLTVSQTPAIRPA